MALLLLPVLAPAIGRAQEADDQDDQDQDAYALAAPDDVEAGPSAQDDEAQGWSEPDEEVPAATPLPPPPVERQGATPAGQWVETQQYGRVWMPYADAYTYAPPSGSGEPYAYVYAPSFGWSWVVAPWIWGWGAWPSFGVYGPTHYGWYGRGWWRTPSRWHYALAYRSGGFHPGVRWSPGHPGRGGWGSRGGGQPMYRSSGSAPRGGGSRSWVAPGWGGRSGHASGWQGPSTRSNASGGHGSSGGRGWSGHGGEARGGSRGGGDRGGGDRGGNRGGGGHRR